MKGVNRNKIGKERAMRNMEKESWKNEEAKIKRV